MSHTKNIFFVMRCRDAQERDMIHSMAAKRGMSASAWVRSLIEAEWDKESTESARKEMDKNSGESSD